MNEYEGVPRVVYGDDRATFVPVCHCGRFVKADAEVVLKGGALADQPNATCAVHGRVKMLFEGFL